MTSTHIPGKGAFLDAEVCEFFFRRGAEWLGRHQLDGGRAAPQLRAALDALRASTQEQAETRNRRGVSAMSADGHVSRPCADMGSESMAGGVLSTEAMAVRLGVGARQARRLASQAGVEPAARDAWHPADVQQLVTERSAGR